VRLIVLHTSAFVVPHRPSKEDSMPLLPVAASSTVKCYECVGHDIGREETTMLTYVSLSTSM
jgi:hypothetical protein